jgi:hypothetical protein
VDLGARISRAKAFLHEATGPSSNQIDDVIYDALQSPLVIIIFSAIHFPATLFSLFYCVEEF